MAETVDVSFVRGYSAEIMRRYAATEDKVRDSVTVKTNVVGKSYDWERLGSSDFGTITTRHQPVIVLAPVHSVRRVTFTDSGGSILLDRTDEPKMLIQPKNDYARNHAEAFKRLINDTVIDAAVASATAVDGADATSSVAIGSGQQIASGSVGLTFEKVNQAARILNTNNVPQENRTALVSPQAVEDLLAEAEVTSRDYTDMMRLKSGTMGSDTFMGFRWIMTTQLNISSTTRTCLFYHKDAIGLAIPMELEVFIDRRVDLATHAWQATAICSAGAVRLQEEGVIQCDITEAT